MKTKQSTLKNFLDLESDSDSEEVSVYTPTPQKAATKLPEMWTRVKNREQMPHQRITAFDIEKDLDTDKVLKAVRKGSTRQNGDFLFDPDLWKGKTEELTIDNYKLSEDELRLYGKTATEIRQRFKDKADAIDGKRQNDDLMQVEETEE